MKRTSLLPSTRLSISRIHPFYIHGHIFSFFDCDNFNVITVKCQHERIGELRVANDSIAKLFNMSPKYWIGVNPKTASDASK